MKRVGGWLGTSKPSSTQSLTSLTEPQALEDAMSSVIHILNDDVDTAEALLSKGTSPFHKLGKGLAAFLRATLGFEQEVMREASERLGEAEASASDHQRNAHRDGYQSRIYPSGSEYALCHAESQLMSAVLAVLNESLTESLKGFYKLRKAYLALEVISSAEQAHLKRLSSSSVGSWSAKGSSQSLAPSTASQGTKSTLIGPETGTKNVQDAAAEDDDFEFVDANQDLQGETPAEYQGHIDSAHLAAKLGDLDLKSGHGKAPLQNDALEQTPEAIADEDIGYDEFTKTPIDLFIHSGTNLCFGILLLLLSLIPPAFSKLLYIIGFKGDRDRGLDMLWRAVKHSKTNGINGAMAGFVLLGYYNAIIGFCDIFSNEAYPKDRCRALLADMRVSYPESRLWMLEEARMLAGDKQLEKAVEMTRTEDKSPLKQVEALQWFEKSLDSMYLHRYEDCAEAFLKCVTLNNWSHGLYYYIAGVCFVELYRQHKLSDPNRAKGYATRATEVLRGVPAHAGKKRFMARQLPFDTFVTRKIQKWEERAKASRVDFVDAVGVAPVEEMIYFWNGYKRMRAEHLEDSLKVLQNTANTEKDPFDEQAIQSFLTSVVLSRLGKTAESKARLQSDILSHDWAQFKGQLKDNWTLPVAHYEMAVNLWVECGGEDGSRAQLQECSDWVEKVARWESYDLDARVGMKITTARDTLRKCGVVAASA